VPSALSPITATPSGEQGTIYRTALGVFERSGPSVSGSRVDPQGLDNTGIRIDAKRRVPHTERSVLASQIFEPRRDVHVVSGRAVTSLQNLVLALIVLSHSEGRCKQHQDDRGQMRFQYRWYSHCRKLLSLT